jgi:hypothetical protein
VAIRGIRLYPIRIQDIFCRWKLFWRFLLFSFDLHSRIFSKWHQLTPELSVHCTLRKTRNINVCPLVCICFGDDIYDIRFSEHILTHWLESPFVAKVIFSVYFRAIRDPHYNTFPCIGNGFKHVLIYIYETSKQHKRGDLKLVLFDCYVYFDNCFLGLKSYSSRKQYS